MQVLLFNLSPIPLKCVTVVAEPVVGATTGVVPAPKGYFKAMHSVCKKYGALFILDEVMSGMGRKSIYVLTMYITNSIMISRDGYFACLGKLWRRNRA